MLGTGWDTYWLLSLAIKWMNICKKYGFVAVLMGQVGCYSRECWVGYYLSLLMKIWWMHLYHNWKNGASAAAVFDRGRIDNGFGFVEVLFLAGAAALYWAKLLLNVPIGVKQGRRCMCIGLDFMLLCVKINMVIFQFNGFVFLFVCPGPPVAVA